MHTHSCTDSGDYDDDDDDDDDEQHDWYIIFGIDIKYCPLLRIIL